MYISFNSKTLETREHDTYTDAATYLLDSVSSDYHKDFYLDHAGKLITNGHSRLDFGLLIFNSRDEFQDFMARLEA
jgi:hypothetical protein